MILSSGTLPFQFIYRDDLSRLPDDVQSAQIKLHGTFAHDVRSGRNQVYTGIPGHGLLHIEPTLGTQSVLPLPDMLQLHNLHSVKFVMHREVPSLLVTANEAALVALMSLDSKDGTTLYRTIARPDLPPYDDPDVPYLPTDSLLVGDRLYIADGYGANMISIFDLATSQWIAAFGGKNTDQPDNTTFGTAHGIYLLPGMSRLLIADRWHSRFQIFSVNGEYLETHMLPAGAWPCGIDFLTWEHKTYGVIANLYGPDRSRPAPIYIVDIDTWEIVSTIRPKEELGIEAAERLHNVSWHTHEGQRYLLCQSWNPGSYFVLAQQDGV